MDQFAPHSEPEHLMGKITVSTCEVPDRTENLSPGRRLAVIVKVSAEPRLSNSIIPPARHAEVAKRKAGEPLKPKVRQKPADEGLFGDEANQTDLVDLAGRQKVAKP
jgi:hypothetical protein